MELWEYTIDELLGEVRRRAQLGQPYNTQPTMKLMCSDCGMEYESWEVHYCTSMPGTGDVRY